jgi:hypothetical protein
MNAQVETVLKAKTRTKRVVKKTEIVKIVSDKEPTKQEKAVEKVKEQVHLWRFCC